MKAQAKPKGKVYPNDHPFAIFAGNYQSQIDWKDVVGGKMRPKEEEDPEDREGGILAFRGMNAKLFDLKNGINLTTGNVKFGSKKAAPRSGSKTGPRHPNKKGI